MKIQKGCGDFKIFFLESIEHGIKFDVSFESEGKVWIMLIIKYS